MQIFFYNTVDAENKVDKSLTDETIKNAVLKDSMYLSTLHLILNTDVASFNFNYCYVPKLKRYYFISKITIQRNDLIEIELIEDCLMSYKAIILKSICEVIECENNFDTSNVSYQGKNIPITTVINGENPFTDKNSIILIASK